MYGISGVESLGAFQTDILESSSGCVYLEMQVANPGHDLEHYQYYPDAITAAMDMESASDQGLQTCLHVELAR